MSRAVVWLIAVAAALSLSAEAATDDAPLLPAITAEAAAPRVDEQTSEASGGVDDDVESLEAAIAARGADAVYPDILAAIDDGNLALRAALADRATRARTTSGLLELQRRRSALRLQTLPLLTPSTRRAYEGLSPEAIAQLRREVEQVTLGATHLAFVGLPELLQSWRQPTAERVTSLFVHVGALVLLAVSALWLAARGTWLWRRARVAVARGSNRTIARFGATLAGTAAALWSSIVGIISVTVVEIVVVDITHFGVVVVVLVWLRGWAWLRLLVALVVEVIRWLAETPLGGLSSETTARVYASVRFAGRAALVIVVANATSEVALGRGALYALSTRAAWLAAGIVATVLVRRWQDDIATRYLALRSTGPLAEAVRNSRQHWYGFFVGLSALVIVFLQAVSSLVRRFLLGFDQTRKALAYVFRRRLEREARRRAVDDTTTPPLPEVVVAALSEHPDDDTSESDSNAWRPAKHLNNQYNSTAERSNWVDLVADRHAADIATLRAAIAAWQIERDRVGTALLVGLPGHGKTTWVRSALRGLTSLPVTTVHLRGRLHSTGALFRTFGAAFDVETGTLEAVKAAITAAGPRVIVIDDLHNLLLRGDPDHRVWRAFEQVVAAIADSAFVLATIDTFAEQHLRWAKLETALFRHRFELRAWSETEIEGLLTRRVARTGYTVRYDDLVVARVDDADRDLRLLATAREYARLIWDFAEGSPAVALQAWKRSLHLHADGHLHVRLFQQPDETLLERATSDARFVLAAVFWNENVTADEAARGLSMPAAPVAAYLERYREVGILVCEHQRYRVATAWWSMVLRFLRRKHLIT